MDGIEIRMTREGTTIGHLITRKEIEGCVSLHDLIQKSAVIVFDSLVNPDNISKDSDIKKVGSIFNPPDRIEDKTVKEMSEYIDTFLGRRFPKGLPDQLRAVMAEMICDVFHDGSRWSESTRQEESRIIQA